MKTRLVNKLLLILLTISLAFSFSGCVDKQAVSCKLPEQPFIEKAKILDCSVYKIPSQIKTCDFLNHNEKEKEIVQWRAFGETYQKMFEQSSGK
jgi:hypothetical protein